MFPRAIALASLSAKEPLPDRSVTRYGPADRANTWPYFSPNGVRFAMTWAETGTGNTGWFFLSRVTHEIIWKSRVKIHKTLIDKFVSFSKLWDNYSLAKTSVPNSLKFELLWSILVTFSWLSSFSINFETLRPRPHERNKPAILKKNTQFFFLKKLCLL